MDLWHQYAKAVLGRFANLSVGTSLSGTGIGMRSQPIVEVVRLEASVIDRLSGLSFSSSTTILDDRINRPRNKVES